MVLVTCSRSRGVHFGIWSLSFMVFGFASLVMDSGLGKRVIMWTVGRGLLRRDGGSEFGPY